MEGCFPEQLPIITSNYVALNQDEQKQIARNLSAYYSDNVCPIYHSRTQIYESPDEHCKKEDAAVAALISLKDIVLQNSYHYFAMR